MLILATGAASAKPGDGEHVIASVPNGDASIQIALPFHDALALSAQLRAAVGEMLNQRNKQASAEIIPIDRKPLRYEVTNRRTGKVTVCKTRAGASRSADRQDNAHGAVCCSVRAVWREA